MNKAEFNIKLGQTIRESRLAQSISQEKLAYLADVNRKYMYLIESGKTNTSSFILYKICGILKIDIELFS